MPIPYEYYKERYHDMDRKRTVKFISACDIEIPLLREDYNYFFKDDEFKKHVEETENKIIDWFKGNIYQSIFKYNFGLSFMPNFIDDKFFIGYSPRRIMDIIFHKILDVNIKTNFDYANPIEFQYNAIEVKEALKKYISEIEEKIKPIEEELDTSTNSKEFKQIEDKYHYNELVSKRDFAKITLSHVDDIFALYNFRDIDSYRTVDYNANKMTTKIDYHIKWRNLAQYLAFISLEQYEETGEVLYLLYPYKFYEKCTKPEKGKRMHYVDKGSTRKHIIDPDFKTFNELCEKIFANTPLAIEFLLNYKDNNRFEVISVLNPGNIDLTSQNLDDFISYKTKKSREVDKSEEEKRAIRDLESKKVFYGENSPFSKHVYKRFYQRGDSQTGYVGFILDNDYVVLDKFFDELQDGTCRPALDSGIYGLPLDLYEKLGRNSGRIRKYRKDNPGTTLVIKKNHTESNKYQDALMELTKRESISLIKARDFVVYNGGTVPKKTLKPNNNKKKDDNKKD